MMGDASFIRNDATERRPDRCSVVTRMEGGDAAGMNCCAGSPRLAQNPLEENKKMKEETNVF
jgi:hypothetical protein